MAAIGATTWVAIASLAVAAVGTAVSIHDQRKAAAAQKEAQAASAAEQAAQAAAARKAQVRQERIRRADIIASSTNSGVNQSSGMLGSLSDVGSLVEGNLANINRNQNSSLAYNMFNQQAADDMSSAKTAEGVASLAGSSAKFFFDNPNIFKGK